MRRFIVILWIILGANFVGLAQDSFKIVGRLGGSLGGHLVLVGRTSTGIVNLGEADMVNGAFEFSGKVDSLIPAYILTAERQPIAVLMLENFEYTLVAGESGIEVQSCSDAQRVWNEFNEINMGIQREKFKMEQEARVAYSQANQMKLKSLQEQCEKMMVAAVKKKRELLDVYKESPVSAFVIVSEMGQMDYGLLKASFEQLGEGAKNSSFGQLIMRQILQFQRVEVGSVAPDFKGVNVNGDTLSLYGTQGKIKLIDFWASWCGPCRQEVPNLCRVYKKYRDKGLEIIGISLDTERQNWEKAMKDEKMNWSNITDLKGWKSEIVGLYCVKGIPCTFLLDEHNNIIAKNLRGRELEKKIEELLGK